MTAVFATNLGVLCLGTNRKLIGMTFLLPMSWVEVSSLLLEAPRGQSCWGLCETVSDKP